MPTAALSGTNNFLEMRHLETIILGQGLAGTAVAWGLHWSNREFLLIDEPKPNSSSRVAAGLITPITGQKFVKTWQWDAFWPEARDFYQRAEQATAQRFFHPQEMVRLFATSAEVAAFQRRRDAGEFKELATEPENLILTEHFDASLGGFTMNPAARLDTVTYLDASRKYFAERSAYVTASLDLSTDAIVTENRVEIPKLAVSADRMIFCQGILAQDNPWFQDVQFKPAKGEILTLQIPGLDESRVIHRNMWLAPTRGGLFRAGSTYEWKDLSDTPTLTAQSNILAQLQLFLRKPVTVVEHRAAVRPIHRNQFPVLGLHAQFPHLAYLNGLGSKGSLYAPGCAARLLQLIFDNQRPERDLDLSLKSR